MKIKNKLIVLLKLILFASPLAGLAQYSEYIVISIVKNNNSNLDGFSHTQWLIPVDSLKDFEFNSSSIIPLFIADYSIDLINDCKSKIPVDPFVLTTSTNFSFPDSITRNINEMVTLISENKKHIQTIKKKWSNGFKETVKIYATPISGSFCSCIFKNYSKVEFDPSQIIFIGFNQIYLREQFWNSSKSEVLKSFDFSIKNNFGRMWH